MTSEREWKAEIRKTWQQLATAAAAASLWRDRWLEQATKERQQRVDAAETNYQQAIAAARQIFEQQTKQTDQEFDLRTSENERRHRQEMAAAQASYQHTLASLMPEVKAFVEDAGLLAAPWQDVTWTPWTPAAAAGFDTLDGETVRQVRIGQLIEINAWDRLPLPALLPLVGSRGVLFKATGVPREAAASGMQSLLLRLLAAIPPGKLRFTFVDPVGLGHNAAPFMHLTDYDDNLVTGKAWTEPQHIEQRLADLTEHMENVIQKYLRNQYASIEDYNAQAGEVAEPYRILTVFDFPVNFSDAAARRLVSIAQNGPRCGVYTVVLVDTSKPLPYGFNLADLEQAATVIAWEGNRWVWQDPDFKDCQLELDTPPDTELFNRILNLVGAVAKDASRVEVPFERIAPPPKEWWTVDSRAGLQAALGPAGARKVQYLELGKGTAHHALLAGRVGSGKSTLLHTLITSLALNYSPEEVQLYLIDFKKGVEFKTYATNALPHAPVIAIESEREFGLSVLQGLDVELKRRGDLFRYAGVDSIADYRTKNGSVLPRILLLVDEFQEFFSADDTIARQCSQILDRLVRQGRAFGIHVLLGSQTLAGSYQDLTRSTTDQMGVRIALQCSEADSRLILADDNPAARLLSRPGEAIYNAANGMVEGNNRFQVAWLPDEQRDRYLGRIRALANTRGYQPPHPQIVFEGNAPAEVHKNQLLNNLLAASTWPAPTRRMSAWLGEPIAIKEPTAAHFRRQSASNLLIVGQQDEQALGMMTTALVSLAAQHTVEGNGAARFYVLDFTPADAPYAEYLRHLKEVLPHSAVWGGRRQLPAMISELATAVSRRLEGSDAALATEPSLYLLIYGLQRARDLRPDDSPAYYSPTGEEAPPPTPAKQLPTILSDGPEVGVHTIVWCDTGANLKRTIDTHRLMREFDQRVAFQMNNDDSSLLIDSPAASSLGPNRALFYSEEESRLEKFRPYGLPSTEWLAWAAHQLRRTGGT